MNTGEIIAYAIAGVLAAWRLFESLAPKFADATIEDWRDKREDSQEMAKLQRAYYDAEQQVTHQMLTDLVSRSFDEKAKSDDFVRLEIANRLAGLNALPELAEDIKSMKYELRNQATQMKILVGLISDIYEKNRQTEEIS